MSCLAFRLILNLEIKMCSPKRRLISLVARRVLPEPPLRESEGEIVRQTKKRRFK